MGSIPQLVDQYWTWLRDRTVLKEQGDWIEVTTPFLDRHNDWLQLYVKQEGERILLSDDGNTLQDLYLSGCELNTPKRQDLLKVTLNGFGVQLEHEALTTIASRDNFPLRKHRLIQAMLAVNDIFYVASATVQSLFFEDVANWLSVNDVRYTPRVKFSGKSGYDHLFDFVIPASKKAPERIIQAINRPTKSSAENFILSWVDTVDIRPMKSRAFAVLNDGEISIPHSVVQALQNYSLGAVAWSNRDQILPEISL